MVTALAMVLAGCVPAGMGKQALPDRVQVTSLMPAFRAILEANDREVRFDALMTAHPDVYGGVIPRPAPDKIKAYLSAQLADQTVSEALSVSIGDEIPKAVKQLTAELGPPGPVRVYVAPSLFTSNGQVRMVADRPVVVFGPDVQAYLVTKLLHQKPPYDVRPLVLHELFHAWHYDANPAMAAVANRLFSETDKPPLYLNLWIEGLATCASMQMDGASKVENALMSRELVTDFPPVAGKVATFLLARQNSTAASDYRDFFWLSGERTDIPKRSAYAAGALVADHIVRKVGLRRAMRLSGEALKKEITDALGAVAAATTAPVWRDVCAGEQ